VLGTRTFTSTARLAATPLPARPSASTPRHVVTIMQHRLLHYRVGLFERLRAECAARGIELHLVHGQGSPAEQTKRDTGAVPWSLEVRNRWVSVLGRDVLWQPLPDCVRRSDLVIIMQENRILSNYPLILRRLLGGRAKVAYWGHGCNFQSDRPEGMRESWKRFWLTKVDWWFGYTNLTSRVLVANGFPDARITCLDNTIDNERFVGDLARIDDERVAAMRRELSVAPDAPVGLYCGSLYPDKRLDFMVDAAERVRARIPTFELVVVGDGPSRPMLEEFVADRPWAHVAGMRTGLDKAACFRMSDVVLSPGLVGLHLLDAFCAGLPLFTTRNARHSPEIDYLVSGVNGFALPDEVEAYAGAVAALLRNRTRYLAVRRAALAAAERYTLDNMVANFVGGIEACLDAEPVKVS